MAAIATQGTGLRHVRKTVAFDGSAGNGAVGSVAGFTLTGRVVIKYVTAYCTEAIVDAGGGSPATLAFGASGAAILATLNPADGLTINKFWTPAGAVSDFAVIQAPWESAFTYGNSGQLAIEASPAFTVANEAINNGTIIVDIWYFPITDDGALAGDDIDTELVAAMTTTQMTESYAADGAAPTVAQALMLIQQLLTEMSIAGTTMTVKKLDGSTTAATLTLNSSTAPTSVTRTG